MSRNADGRVPVGVVSATNACIKVAHETAGDGPTVVLIHGMGSSHRQWRPTVPALTGQYRVISIDLPGFGETASLYARAFSGFADATAGLLKDLNAGPVAVVGHSFGGMVAVDLADRYPDMVRQVILVSSAGMHSGAHRIRWVWKLFRLIGPMLGPIFSNRLTARAFLRTMATRTTPEMVDDIAWSGRRARAMWRPVLANYDFRSALDRVAERLPLSLIWGDQDRVVPLADGEAMQRATGAELATVRGAGHLLMYEKSAEFNRILLRMLEGTATPGSR